MTTENVSTVRRKLLSWYEKHQRDLPWRKTTDPYAIWISETMLQQTQVKTVLSYYCRFLSRFPDIEALAHARLEHVLRVWSGLGYYRRAESLRTAARQIMREHGGKLPQDYHQLRALAGIGDYTAGALLSIAFGKNHPAIDGNARRVLGRLYAISSERRLRSAAARLVAGIRPGDLNQALMELGATLCTPKVPNCEVCPIKRECRVSSRGERMIRAHTTRRVTLTDVSWPLAIVRYKGNILLHRRGTGKLLAGLWELPGAEASRPGAVRLTLRRELRDAPLRFNRMRCIGEIRHSITYRRIRAPIYLFECTAPLILPGGCWRWVPLRRTERYAVSAMTKKALAFFASHETRSA